MDRLYGFDSVLSALSFFPLGRSETRCYEILVTEYMFPNTTSTFYFLRFKILRRSRFSQYPSSFGSPVLLNTPPCLHTASGVDVSSLDLVPVVVRT